MDELLKSLNFKDGLIPAAITDAESRQLLTLCYMSEEALRRTLESGVVHVFRRSKGRLMKKGESSGHTQKVREVRVDCAGNSLEIAVDQKVAACHAGYFTCYYRRYDPETETLEVCEETVFDPTDVYGEDD